MGQTPISLLGLSLAMTDGLHADSFGSEGIAFGIAETSLTPWQATENALVTSSPINDVQALDRDKMLVQSE